MSRDRQRHYFLRAFVEAIAVAALALVVVAVLNLVVRSYLMA
jgi:hypothetical protein